MTLPHERTYAVLNTRAWLKELCLPGRITKTDLRAQALSLLKHYPTAEDLRNPAKAFEKAGTKFLRKDPR